MITKPVRFLLIEDDDDHAELITLGLLAAAGTPKVVDRARDGEEALASLRQSGTYWNRPRPDVVLLDLHLPKVSGHEVLAAIKSDAQFDAIPVVVLTTSQASEDKVKAYARHANSYLTKPTDFCEFGRMIENLSTYWAAWNQRSN
jgi:CheY-like chemotaxis protein